MDKNDPRIQKMRPGPTTPQGLVGAVQEDVQVRGVMGLLNNTGNTEAASLVSAAVSAGIPWMEIGSKLLLATLEEFVRWLKERLNNQSEPTP